MTADRGIATNMEIIGMFRDAHYHEVRGEVPRQTFISMAAVQYIERINQVTVYVRTFSGIRAR